MSKYNNRVIFERIQSRVLKLRKKYSVLGIDTDSEDALDGDIFSNLEFSKRNKEFWNDLASQELQEAVDEECVKYAVELGLLKED